MKVDHRDIWSLNSIESWLESGSALSMHADTREHIAKCRQYLEDKIARHPKPIYGINTGFGSLCDTEIDASDKKQLQLNLVRSHACGAGVEIDPALVRLMMLLKVKGLSHGHSGVRTEVTDQLIALINQGISPVVYAQGSLGASGDLAPLAHISMGLIGEGEVQTKNGRTSASDALKTAGITPIGLVEKEGLALLNGTQFMSGIAAHVLIQARKLFRWADTIAAMSLDAFDGRIEPFFAEIQDVRPHPGQALVAGNISALLEGSAIAAQEKTHVQDPYSFRCVPQVHGASRDAWDYARQVVEREINSVTDNPTVFPHQDMVISAGNFHGQPLALALDFLCIAMAEVGSISERRIYKLISGQRNLPEFLAPNAGLNSGFMIPQYTAASIVSRNKQLCSPSSIDSIDSSNGQEDHVSMGANSANRALEVVKNLQSILGIELLVAGQALEFRRPLKSSIPLESIHDELRKVVPFMESDQFLQPLMASAESFLSTHKAPKSVH